MQTTRFNNKGARRSFSGSRSASSGSRSSRFGGGRPSASGRFGGGRRASRGPRIDPSKFISKAVIVGEEKPFIPEHKFEDFNVKQEMKQRIAQRGYILPTPIQDKTINHIIAGEDVVGIAETGTGKTAAFLIPLINKVLLHRQHKVLIVAPTRELAIQIDQEFKLFAKGMGITSACCVGGASIAKQLSELRYNNNFVIGTPGRLKDFIDRRRIKLFEFTTIVLDEADRMLDMGFISDMRFLMAGMAKERQTLFFSATLSPEIEKLIGEFLHNPVKISVKTRETARNVEQDVVRIGPGRSKIDTLHDLLIQEEFSKVLIFGRTKHGVEKLYEILTEKGFKAESIHGNKKHSKRQRALEMFKTSRIQILVATDVAARGLDISDVSHVINYDLPETYDDYIHRIGRTGRGDKSGKALTFIE